MAKTKDAKDKLDRTLGIKINADTDEALKRIADEIYPGEHNAYSMFIRRILTKAIAEHGQGAKIATRRERKR